MCFISSCSSYALVEGFHDVTEKSGFIGKSIYRLFGPKK
jgi:hypothetical protein